MASAYPLVYFILSSLHQEILVGQKIHADHLKSLYYIIHKGSYQTVE